MSQIHSYAQDTRNTTVFKGVWLNCFKSYKFLFINPNKVCFTDFAINNLGYFAFKDKYVLAK